MTERYQILLRRLLENPEQFESRGEGNALLKEHFDGAPAELLRPLLRHDNASVRGTAIFVANELGVAATELIDDIVPLIRDADVRTQYDAIETVSLCSNGDHTDKFIYVLQALEDPHPVICSETMRLVSKANGSQLEAGMRLVKTLASNQAAHQKGLKALLNWTDISSADVIEMLNDENELVNKYGAIVANRRIEQSPELIQHATNSGNEIVSRFATEAC